MTETGFEINGKRYPVPAVPDMDMDELQLLYEATGITLQGWAHRESEDPAERLEWENGVKGPSWMRVLLHIAYQRGNPNVPVDEVAKLIKKVKWLDATMPMLEEQAAQEPADPNPVGAENAPEPSSSPEPPSSVRSSNSSGSSSPTDSTRSSDEPAGAPATTGTTGSGGEAEPAPLKRVV